MRAAHNKQQVVAIDGPSGSGKSTIAKLLALKLKAIYMDTGAMYRAIGYYINKKGISFDDEYEIEKELHAIKFSYGKNESSLVSINGENLTPHIRSSEVSQLASKISKIPFVRDYLLEIQRKLGERELCVMEGRDIGSVVFPRAFVKIFLTADVNERGKRRFLQLKEDGLNAGTKEEVISDLIKRDERDMNRAVAPLKPMKDSVILDTTKLTIEQVVDKIYDIFQQRKV